MRPVTFGFAFLIACLVATVPAKAGDHVIGVGSHIVIPTPRSGAVTVSNGRVVRAEDLGAGIRVTGRKAGVAAVATSSGTHLVTVLRATAFRTYKALRAEAAGMRGIEVAVDDGALFIRGRLLRADDWDRLAAAAGGGGDYSFRAEIDPLIRDDVSARFDQLAKAAGLPPLDIQLSPATVRIAADRPDLVKRVSAVFAPYGFSAGTAVGALTLEPLVRVQILVTEVRKSHSRRLGVKWPASTEATLLPALRSPGTRGRPLNVELQALEQAGHARVLASPNLLCRSGKEAQFLAGGEYPIKIATNRRQDVVWKRYGVMLRIKPRADFSGRMSIALETEVSTLDKSRDVDGLPALLTNRIESHFDLRESRTIALSGLIRRDQSSGSHGLPILGTLPVLGPLFSSKEFQDDRTELIVFVTPDVLPQEGTP